MNPYLIQGPALISFSGGRTSAFMLHQVIQAHGGTLPDDVHVVFANTGKELEETLRFVHDCETHWGVPIVWLERDKAKGFAVVTYGTASRNGEPFAQLIADKKALPNWQARWCTSGLKIMPMFAYMASLGFPPGTYREAIGLRHDEGVRLLKMYARNDTDNRQCVAPLDKARVVKADITAFWAASPFDLGLEDGDGNCDLCFATGKGVRLRRLRKRPTIGRWWTLMETGTGRVFDRRDSVASLVEEARTSPELPIAAQDEYDAECGLLCEPEAA